MKFLPPLTNILIIISSTIHITKIIDNINDTVGKPASLNAFTMKENINISITKNIKNPTNRANIFQINIIKFIVFYLM